MVRDEAIGRLLDMAEDASPVHAVEAVTRALGESLGATSIAFLILDLSGRGLVRLDTTPESTALHDHQWVDSGQESSELGELLPFDGGPVERALRTQSVQVLSPPTFQ